MGLQWRSGVVVLLVSLVPGGLSGQSEDGYVLPPPPVQELFSTDPNFTTLDQLSPDGVHFLVPHRTELSTLERMAETTYRLGEIELRPGTDRLWHLDTYGIDGVGIYSLSERRTREVDLPNDAFASDFMWSPDGSQVAFLAHLRQGTEVWVADASTGRTRSLGDTRISAVLGTGAQGQGSRASRMLQWLPDGGVMTLAVPSDRGPEPDAPATPGGPMVRRTRDEATPTRTYPNLLRDPYDAALLEHYTTSRIVVLQAGAAPRFIGAPAMWESLSLSPDGSLVLGTRMTRPFSFITSYRGFPRVTEVLDLSGRVVATLEEGELRESGGGFGGDGGDGPRGWTWRPDGQLVYLERGPKPDDPEDPRMDRIMVRDPGDDQRRVLVETPHAIESFVFSSDGATVFAELREGDRSATAFWSVGGPVGPMQLLTEWHDREDILADPGSLWTGASGNGLRYAPVSADRQVLVRGDGYAEDLRPRPFVDRVSLDDRSTERVFEGATDSFDQPLAMLDPRGERLIVSREGVHDFPDSFLFEDGRWGENLTENEDPFPELTAARRVDFEFMRRDGLQIRGRVSLPVDYVEGTRVPAIFWTYPREFRSEEAFEQATIRSRNLNAHTRLTWLRWSDIWLTQGYALVYPDIPIVGENYNDYYISNMVDGMYAAVRAVDELGIVDIDRIGHGGHSYGAFATANFLAHTPFFKAGIAGDGAYNRSLTPMGFQAEPRDIWEAPHVYVEMSPFFKADQINTPLLMYHGADDNNTGTFPIQSERLMQALTGLGKTAALYLYPFESHTPRAIENNLDMWARWIEWFDRYVKNPGEGEPVTDGGGGAEGA